MGKRTSSSKPVKVPNRKATNNRYKKMIKEIDNLKKKQ